MVQEACRWASGLDEVQKHERWMELLLRRAAAIGEIGEIPVAAVVLDSLGRAVGWGVNRRQREQRPLGHAELMALEQAARLRGDWRFNDCSLIVTLEPCPMCAGALVQARMGRVIFGAHDRKRGALGGCLNLATDPSAHHRMEVIGGVMEPECRSGLEAWFRQRRQQRQAQKNGMPVVPAPAG
ncbi:MULTISPECIES: nucleoside deaminase [unclassified Synechococcus]|uniref:nucleoside deaminase n=1 Tax=unclassified Synechococcus TaxID=2626047 RepID=UPI00200169A6|nr:nucleoside deaminase [Synechococcus sp. A10-1-5-1]UPM50455.1 nucleoside deaminase [Synechococcus sp. A10-1-5-1]